MVTMLVLTLGLAAPAELPLVFLDPSEVQQAQGVRLEAYPPMDAEVLLPADPERPSLWYMPASTFGASSGRYIWYQRVDKSEPEYMDQRVLCVGILSGGGWNLKPVRNTVPPWGGINNIVMRRSPHTPTWGGFNVFQIVPQGGLFTMLYWDQPGQGEAGALVASSTYGFHWNTVSSNTVFTDKNDAFTVLKLAEDRYYCYQTVLEPWADKPYEDNLPGVRRVQSLRTSRDMLAWSPQQVILRPDAQDPQSTEFYLLRTFLYGGWHAGLLMKYYADPDRPRQHGSKTETELIVSTDGVNWRRPFRNTDLGFWSYAEPFVYQGNQCFAAHRDRAMVLVRYPMNHLTGVASDGEGTFVTPVLPFRSDLAVDIDTRGGWAEFAILDVDGNRLVALNVMRLEDTAGESVRLEWSGYGSSQLPLFEGRLRVRLHDARLYGIRTFAGVESR